MITEESGTLVGPMRRPVNSSANLGAGSIHDDATAQNLGFRGGTVAGSIHMDQFPPLLVQTFGPAWFETGSLSLHFRNATTDGEPVQASVERPADTTDSQTSVRMLREDGLLVAEGTASVGRPGTPSHLSSIDLRPTDPSELVLLRDVKTGDALEEYEEAVDGAGLRARIDSGRLTEPLDWYTGDSPWGGPIAYPSAIVGLLWRRASRSFSRGMGGAVGLFGAIEVRHVDGPLFADRPYQVSGEVVAVGSSPKTEYVWFDSHAAEDGRRVASMRMQLRWMKASSPKYQQA